MINSSPFRVLEQPCEEAVAWITRRMADLGLRVLVTFDVQLARISQAGCTCPHHGTDQCDCQLSVLFVYKTGAKPATLILHGYDGRTWFSLVNSPQQPVDPHLVAMIQKSVAVSPSMREIEHSHAT